MTAGRAAGLVLAASLVLPAHAADDPALYPAAQCAAFWFGWDDFARASTMLDRRAGDLDLAERFRAEAHRQTTTGAASVDAYIDAQRPLMMRLVDEGIYAPGVSRDLMERLIDTCGIAP